MNISGVRRICKKDNCSSIDYRFGLCYNHYNDISQEEYDEIIRHMTKYSKFKTIPSSTIPVDVGIYLYCVCGEDGFESLRGVSSKADEEGNITVWVEPHKCKLVNNLKEVKK